MSSKNNKKTSWLQRLSATEISFGRNVPQVEMLMFTRHLATMITAGIPLADALETLENQTKSGRFASILAQVRSKVENGQPLADTLSLYPKVFSPFFVSLMRVSEESGTLDTNLEFVSAQLARTYALQKKIQAALLYPALIVLAMTFMGGFVAFFVLPQLIPFFSAFAIDLPLSTRILLGIASVSRDYGWLILSSLVALFVLVQAIFTLKQPRLWWDTQKLRIPVLGAFWKDAQLATLLRNWGVLMKSGVPVTRALEVTAGTVGNTKYRQDLVFLLAQIQSGVSISEALQQAKFTEFPKLVVKMIAVGEKTGKLDESLLYLSNFYEEEIENTSKNLTTVIEPLLLLVIGISVGMLALAVISPIYELSGSIRR